MKKYPQNTYLYNGDRVLNTWIKTRDVAKYQPITQVYGIVFNEKNEILICRQSRNHDWNLPGGHPIEGEMYEETLTRELLEEIDTAVTNIQALGVQKVTIADKPGAKPIYQMRCVADVEKLHPQTGDPDSGVVWERKFIPVNEITKYIEWGDIGKAMFADAVKSKQIKAK